jgi:formate dehydrogenase subunit gamma
MALAVPFVLGVLVMIALWTRQNLPERLDWQWLKRGGGFLDDSPDKPPARRFNTGQKIVFWAVALGGLFLTATGIALMFPFYWSGYTGMQTVQVLHAAAALLMIGLIIGHIYIGTIGMVGAFQAMWSGRVDRNWAEEHHSLWYRSIAQSYGRRASGAEGVAAPNAPVPRSGWGSFATGLVLAMVLGIVIAGVYSFASISSSESQRNAAVHLDPK